METNEKKHKKMKQHFKDVKKHTTNHPPNEKRITNVQNNIVRKISIFLNENLSFNKLKGYFYFNLHNYFLFVIGFITLFSTSIHALITMLIIVSLDANAIVVLHECPLTTMERKYLGFTSCDIRNNMLKNMGIVYKCDHNYEKQLELLINVWCFIVTKCVCIVFLKMFQIQLFDTSLIYTNG